MPTATVTSKGQLTVPKAIRDRLRLKAGDTVWFIEMDDGRIVLQARTVDLRDLKGILKPRRKLSLAQMNETIRSRGGRDR